MSDLRTRPPGRVAAGERVQGTIARLRPLREREFLPGQVLEWTVQDDCVVDRVKGPQTVMMRVYAYDDWARTLSIAAPGDRIVITGEFDTIELPAHPGGVGPGERIVVLSRRSYIRIEQAADHGDTMVLKFQPDGLDEPEISVKRAVVGTLAMSNDARQL